MQLVLAYSKAFLYTYIKRYIINGLHLVALAL